MKITEVRAIYPAYQGALSGWRTHLWQIVVHIQTDTGHSGWGYGGGGVPAVELTNRHFRDLLLGRSLNSQEDIEGIWDDLYTQSLPYGRRGLAIMALSGVDLALWDLLGKAEGVPVYALLGADTPEPIRAYATGSDPEWFAELGFTAYKFSHRWDGDPAAYDRAVAMAETGRQILGPEGLLMVDCYMSWTAEVAQEMATRLAPYDIYWFEDVLTPDHLAEQAALRQAIQPIHLAGGEHEFTHHGFAQIARAHALDIWQPDVTWCGGVTAARRIVNLAQAEEIPVILHRGGEVWGLHVIAGTACQHLAERVLGHRGARPDHLWLGEPEPQDGHLVLSDVPGFGVLPNQEMI